MTKPKLLDLFCGAGGCTKGYQRAGFWVRGVDHKRQPRYCGEEFIQADALEYLARLIESGEIEDFDAVHASPPCQAYSTTKSIWGNAYPDLLGSIREGLIFSRSAWVIENVNGAPLRHAIKLCGVQFGLKVYRHRFFESSEMLLAPAHLPHPEPMPRAGHGISPSGYISVAGNICHADHARKAMGIDWMTRDELSQAIPPAYTEFIGNQLMTAIRQDGIEEASSLEKRIESHLSNIDARAAAEVGVYREGEDVEC